MKLSALFLCLAGLFAGCSSYVAKSNPAVNMDDYHTIFVQTTFNDNHGTSRLLVAALQARGREVISGPATMKPFSVQGVLTYDDAWSTNIRDHIEILKLELRDNRTDKIVAFADFEGAAAFQLTPEQVVAKILDDMLRSKTTPKKS